MKKLLWLTTLLVLPATFVFGQAKYSNEFQTTGEEACIHVMNNAVTSQTTDLHSAHR
jgi:hypothetical protein